MENQHNIRDHCYGTAHGPAPIVGLSRTKEMVKACYNDQVRLVLNAAPEFQNAPPFKFHNIDEDRLNRLLLVVDNECYTDERGASVNIMSLHSAELLVDLSARQGVIDANEYLQNRRKRSPLWRKLFTK